MYEEICTDLIIFHMLIKLIVSLKRLKQTFLQRLLEVICYENAFFWLGGQSVPVREFNSINMPSTFH